MRLVFYLVLDFFLQNETKIEEICDGHNLSVRKIVKLVLLHFREVRVQLFRISLVIRELQIFFDLVGHQNTYASTENKHFLTKYCHPQTYQNYEQS